MAFDSNQDFDRLGQPGGQYGRRLSEAGGLLDFASGSFAHPSHRFGLKVLHQEFRANHAHACKQARRDFVVGDTRGAPGNVLDIADGVIAVVRGLLEWPSAQELRGIFHMTAGGETSWADFAKSDLRGLS